MPFSVLLLPYTVTFMQWLCVNILASLGNTLVSHELAFLASQRAKFLECLGKELADRKMLPPDISVAALFLAGLCSLLESAMQMPVTDILECVLLDEAVLTALTTGGESAYTPWLQLMDLYERGEWEESIAIARTLHLLEKDLACAYATALGWSGIFFTTVYEPCPALHRALPYRAAVAPAVNAAAWRLSIAGPWSRPLR